MKSLPRLFFFAVIIISIGINLGYLLTQSIRLDEAQSIWVATKTLPTLMKITAQDVQVPLYPILLHFWLNLFGASITMARLMSLLFFVATLPMLYRLIKEAANQKTASLGILLFALSPFVIWYGQEARTYSLLTLTAALSHLFFLRFYRSEGKKAKLAYFLSAVAGLFTHYFFIFILLAQGFYLLKWAFPPQKPWLRFIGIQTLIGLFFMPWVAYVLKQGLAANTQPLIPPPSSYNLIQVYVNFFLGFQTQGVQNLLVSLWPLVLIILFVVFTRKIRIQLNQSDYFLSVSVIPVLLVYLASFFRPIFLPRYLILVVPSLFAVIAWLLINVGKKFFSAISIGIILLMLFSLNYQSQSLTSPIKEDYRTLVAYLTQAATPQDIIAVSAPFTVYPIEYYYAGIARIDTIPKWDRFIQGPIPAFTVANLELQLADYRNVYQRLFVVLSYNQGYQNEIIDYLDQHYQLLDQKSFPAQILVRVYQLRYDPPITLSSGR